MQRQIERMERRVLREMTYGEVKERLGGPRSWRDVER